MGYVFFRGLPQISLSFLTSVPSTIKGTFGIAGNIVNTLYIIILTLLIATPIGVGGAIYLNEYAKPGKNRPADRIYDRNPFRYSFYHFRSVWYGIFRNHPGTWLFHPDRRPDPDPYGSSPDHAKHTGSLKNSSCDLPRGALGIGATKWYMIRTILLPSAMPGIITGIILAIGRIVGESAALYSPPEAAIFCQRPLQDFSKNLRIRRNPYDPAVLEHVQGTI